MSVLITVSSPTNYNGRLESCQISPVSLYPVIVELESNFMTTSLLRCHIFRRPFFVWIRQRMCVGVGRCWVGRLTCFSKQSLTAEKIRRPNLSIAISMSCVVEYACMIVFDTLSKKISTCPVMSFLWKCVLGSLCEVAYN